MLTTMKRSLGRNVRQSLRASLAVLLAATTALVPLAANASSHREAPFIGELPKLDGTDFYMFRSYEPGREGFVTFLANYIPLQNSYGGPLFFTLDPDAVYEIKVDNNGDAAADLSFQFRFQNQLKGLAVPAGGVMTPVAIGQIGGVGANGNPADTGNLNTIETYTVDVMRTGQPAAVRARTTDGRDTFTKPADFFGVKSFGSVENYNRYADAHITPISIPGCATPGRVFVGQRSEGFYISLGQVFDLLNFQELRPDGSIVPFVPAGEANANRAPNQTDDLNITTIALEVPIGCLTSPGEPVIGAWTTSSLPRGRVLRQPGFNGATTTAQEVGPMVQVSRLSHPLVNELVIGVPDKDRFNGSRPQDDTQFAQYVTNPSVPVLIQALYGPGSPSNIAAVQAPNVYPRQDLIETFLLGLNLPGIINIRPRNVVPAEMMRLNTTVATTARGRQSPLGLLSLSDLAGYPNGRRPGDDVVDITLRVAMGALLRAAPAIFAPGVDVATRVPAGTIEFVDGVRRDSMNYRPNFPYLNTPNPGDRTP